VICIQIFAVLALQTYVATHPKSVIFNVVPVVSVFWIVS